LVSDGIQRKKINPNPESIKRKEQRIAVIIDETANRKKQCNPLKGSGVPFLQTLIFLNRCN